MFYVGWRNAFDSACHLHNETMNIWTHLLGFICMVLLYVFTLSTLSPFGLDRLNLAVYATPNSYTYAQQTIQNYIPFDTHNNTFDYLRHDTSIDVHDTDVVPDISTQHARLNDIVANVHKHTPNLYELIDALRDKVYDTELMLIESTGYNHTLLESRKLEFIKYVESFENKFDQLRDQVSNLTLARQSADKYYELLHMINTRYGEIANVLIQRDFDVLSASRAIINQFTAQISNSTQHIRNTAKQPFLYFVPFSETIQSKIEQMSNVVVGYTDSTNNTITQYHQQSTGLHSYLPTWPIVCIVL